MERKVRFEHKNAHKYKHDERWQKIRAQLIKWRRQEHAVRGRNLQGRSKDIDAVPQLGGLDPQYDLAGLFDSPAKKPSKKRARSSVAESKHDNGPDGDLAERRRKVPRKSATAKALFGRKSKTPVKAAPKMRRLGPRPKY